MFLSDIFTVITWVLTAAGIWKILNKCGSKGWWALIPGVRMYKLGLCADRAQDGLTCLILEIINVVVSVARTGVAEDTPADYWMTLALGVVAILTIIFEIRVYAGVVRMFNLRKIWILFLALVEWIALPILGFSKKFQPAAVGGQLEEDRIAGTRPTELAAALDRNEGEDGLTVHVRARTVRDFGGKVRYLLKDINLTIPGGSLVLLLGGSGAGKTTLLNAINGYEKADADIRLRGVDVYEHYDEMKYRIGFVPQQDLLRMNDTVVRTLDDAALMRLPKDVRPEERKQKLDAVLDVLGLAGRQEGLIAKKSGGQKKRISIGAELISDPDLFILDEPDSGLDGVIARELFERLRALADEGRIVIAITHTPDRVADLFDKVIVLARDSGKVGRLAFYGTPDEAKEFFGKDTMEHIVMAINSPGEGGEGRADEFIEKYAEYTRQEAAADNEG